MQSNSLHLAVEHEGQIRFYQKTSETGGTAKKIELFKILFKIKPSLPSIGTMEREKY